ncbi:MAG: glycosyltransferase family 2 protein [Cyclobacteriaceae bacterium]
MKLNLVIPMAGLGSRFSEAGYSKPKPFIDVLGKPMIERVIDNLIFPGANLILIARAEHLEKEKDYVHYLSKRYNASIVSIDRLTEGTACTVLYARKFIDNDLPLLIANSDQIVDVDISQFVNDCKNRDLNGSILVFREREGSKKWSYVRLDDMNLVVEAKEKDPISDLATVGIYLFAKGRDFVSSAIDMIVRNDRVNGEFYTCPIYNYTVREGSRIGVFEISFEKMHGIGVPEDLEKFVNLLKNRS